MAPPLTMLLFMGGGCALSQATHTQGRMVAAIFPQHSPHNLLARISISCLSMAVWGVRTRNACDSALQDAGTHPTFQPEASLLDAGPCATCRNPMHWAVLTMAGMVGAGFLDNAWVAVGSYLMLWLYLHFVVVPAEKKLSN